VQYPIIVPRGTDYDATVLLYDEEGEPYDLEGSTIAIGVKYCANDTDYVITKTAPYDTELGGCVFHFDPVDTENIRLPRRCSDLVKLVYDIGLLDADNYFRPIVDLSPFYVAPTSATIQIAVAGRDYDPEDDETASVFTISVSSSALSVDFYLTQDKTLGTTVDFGDGTTQRVSDITAHLTHTYDSAGTYRVIARSMDGTQWSPGDNATHTFVIPKNLSYAHLRNTTELSEYAFFEQIGVTDFILEEPISIIGDMAFTGCHMYSIYLPETVTEIRDSAFSRCALLESINIPDGVAQIGEGAFNACSALPTITIPEGVTSIRANTFAGCESLASIYLPVSLSVVETMAFYNCNALTDVYYAGTQSQWATIAVDGTGNGKLTSATIHYNSVGA